MFKIANRKEHSCSSDEGIIPFKTEKKKSSKRSRSISQDSDSVPKKMSHRRRERTPSLEKSLRSEKRGRKRTRSRSTESDYHRKRSHRDSARTRSKKSKKRSRDSSVESHHSIKKTRSDKSMNVLTTSSVTSESIPSTSTGEKKSSKELRTTACDLFGGADEKVEEENGKKASKIPSIYTRRLSNGISKQNDDDKEGSHFIELKIYNYDEIRNVSPMNRWRQAIVSVKNRSNNDTEAWDLLSKYVIAVRKEFANCPPTFISSYNSYN